MKYFFKPAITSQKYSVKCKVKIYNYRKRKIRPNEPKNWKNNKNTEAQPKLSGSYKNEKGK